MITQDLSEFALHVRAILGFPLEAVRLLTPGASATLKTDGTGQAFAVTGIEEALALPARRSGYSVSRRSAQGGGWQ